MKEADVGILMERIFTRKRAESCPLYNHGSCAGKLSNTWEDLCRGDITDSLKEEDEACAIQHWIRVLLEEL